jgi:hypothetical protein
MCGVEGSMFALPFNIELCRKTEPGRLQAEVAARRVWRASVRRARPYCPRGAGSAAFQSWSGTFSYGLAKVCFTIATLVGSGLAGWSGRRATSQRDLFFRDLKAAPVVGNMATTPTGLSLNGTSAGPAFFRLARRLSPITAASDIADSV